MFKALFVWLDATPAAYWFGAATATMLFGLWLAAGLSGRATTSPGRGADRRFALLTLLLILAWRWPVFFHPNDFNPDEGQLIAAALTYAHDPFPFRSVDLTTSGPLNGLALLPTHWLGLPQDYFNARLVAVLLEWGALLSLYGTLRTLFSPAVTAFALLPGILFFATATDTDFIHYSSEHPSLFLGALGVCLIWRHRPSATAAGARRWLGWLAGGICIGLLPWAKLQSAPIAAAAAIWGAGLAWFDAHRSPRHRLGWIAALAGAALLPSATILGMLAAADLLDQFRLSYIAAALGYMETPLGWSDVVAILLQRTTRTWHMPALALGTIPALIAHAYWTIRQRGRPDLLYWGAAGLTLAASYTVIAPRHDFLHYLMFLVPAIVLWTGIAAGALWTCLPNTPTRRLLLGGFVVLAGLLQLGVRVRNGLPENYGRLATDWRTPYEDVARHIRAMARPGDRLAIWGWWTHLQVETGLPQATREAHSERQITESPLRDSFFRPRYLTDLQSSRPVFFVDAVGPDSFGYSHRAGNGHETFPALGDFVAANYVLLKDFGRARLFLRKDQAEARTTPLPLLEPLALEGFTEKTANGAVARLGDAPPPDAYERRFADQRIFGELIPHHPLDLFAHAPSRLVHPLPPGTLRLRGAAAIQPQAYANPGNSTDGATFTVRWIAADGSTTPAWERRLDPQANPADRAPAEFDLTAPAAGAVAVEFVIDPGRTARCDWTYWHDLRLDVHYRP